MWVVIKLKKAGKDILGRENSITQKDKDVNSMAYYTNYSGVPGIGVEEDDY